MWRWERGETICPTSFRRRLLAEYFQVGLDELGFHQPRRSLALPSPHADDDLTLDTTSPGITQDVKTDQEQWRATRDALGKTRRMLAVLAEQLYPRHRTAGLKNTGVITHPA